MMPVGATVLVVLLSLLAMCLVILGLRGLRAANTFRRLKTSAISSLGEGHVELSGIIRAAEAPLHSAWREACVLVYSSREEKSGDRYTKPLPIGTAHVPAELTDESGTCSIDLSHVEIYGTTKARKIDGARLSQLVIEHGAQVLIATRVTPEQQQAFGAYRTPGTQRSLAGTPKDPILIYVGSHTSALVRLSWHSAITTGCGLALAALALATAYHSVVVQALRTL
jgi:hypothetical protein